MAATIVCRVMGVIFIAIAIWGFITGDRVWIFHVNTTHNIVHLVSGIGALACSFSPKAAKLFSIIFGAVYGLVGVLGFAGVPFLVDLLHLNAADNWLHIGIAAVFLLAAFIPVTHPPSVRPLPH